MTRSICLLLLEPGLGLLLVERVDHKGHHSVNWIQR
jgi:hypothetical protein